MPGTETIIKIERTVFKTMKFSATEYIGYLIQTSDQLIKIGILNDPEDLYRSGCQASSDDLAEFIGSPLLSISVSEQEVMPIALPEIEDFELANFKHVNIETSLGLLQITFYNVSNKYLDREFVILSKQVNIQDTI
ncbi:hypothetical protein [Dyadobacter bucti]|uniref:hypothetical protein n=1 Tax=Dyadobacter bucti TaxID=2572203 RepID=UPI001108D790|nr:hypothetical protein [Dyadobacter bucti]